MDTKQIYGQRFSSSASSAISGSGSAVVTQSASSGRVYFITQAEGSSADATAQLDIYSEGTTYYIQRTGNAQPHIVQFNPPIAGTSGSAISARVISGGGSAFVHFGGYFIG